MSYKNTIYYSKYAQLLTTDSGRMQKEALFSKTQTLTVREETEWPETISGNWNRLVKPINLKVYKSALKCIYL